MADNLLEKASILLTPTAYNDGSMLSVKPENGDGDFTFSRGSAATRVNAQGLVENVQIISSELVSNGNFSQIGTEEVSNGNFSQEGSELVTNGDFATDSDWILANGAVINNGSVNIIGVASSFRQDVLTSGKSYRLDYQVVSTNGASFRFQDGVTSYTDINQTVGYHTYYFKATGTRVQFQALGNIDARIDNVSVKEVGQDWVLGGSGSNKATIGSNSATITSVDGNSYLQQNSVLTSGKSYKISYEILSSSGSSVLKMISSLGLATVPTTVGTHTVYGTATTTTFYIERASNGINATITNISVKEVGQDWTLGTGWSIGDGKIIADGTMTASDTLNQIYNFTDNNKYRFKFTVSDYQSGSVYIREPFDGSSDAVSSNGTFTFDYIVGTANEIRFRSNDGFTGSFTNISVKEITDDTDLPRIDYTDGCGSWLLEPQSTNLSTKSENISGWGFPTNVTTTQNYGTSPDGSVNSTRLQFTSNGFMNDGLTLTSGTEYTLSIYAKRNDNGTQSFGFYVDGTPTIVGGITLTDEWQRFTYTYTASSSSSIGLAGDSGADVSVFGFQAEELSYATSYIPTNGSIATRLADVATNSGNSTLINSTEGVLYAEIASLTKLNDDERTISLSDGTNVNTIRLQFNALTNNIRVFVGNGTTQVNMNTTISDITDFSKLAFKYKENDFALWIDGVEVLTDTSGTTFTSGTLNKLGFVRGDTSEYFYGKVKALAVYKEALTDEQLQSLTTI